MKRIFFFALAALALASCANDEPTTEVESSEPYLSISPSVVKFDLEGGMDEFTISSNVEWTIVGADDQEWFYLETTSGSGDGVVPIQAFSNYSYNSYSTILTISSADGELSSKVVVSQSGIQEDEEVEKNEDGSYIYSTSFKASKVTEAGYTKDILYVVVVNPQVVPTVECEAEEVSLYSGYEYNDDLDSQVAPSGSVEYAYYFDVAENEDQVAKTFTFVVTFGEIVKELTVSQDAFIPGEDLQVVFSEIQEAMTGLGLTSTTVLSGEYALKTFELEGENVTLYFTAVSGTNKWLYQLSQYSFRLESGACFTISAKSDANAEGKIARVKYLLTSEYDKSIISPTEGEIVSGADTQLNSVYYYLLNWMGTVDASEGVSCKVNNTFAPRGFVVKYQQ